MIGLILAAAFICSEVAKTEERKANQGKKSQ
jgi:hypothetical protein